jgi:hypothetical protein
MAQGERPTAGVAGTQISPQEETAVDRLARAMGARAIPEVGGRGEARPPRGGKRPAVVSNRGGARVSGKKATGASHRASTKGTTPAGKQPGAAARAKSRAGVDVAAQRALAARREHSKGRGNLPKARRRGTADERPEDRRPRDTPKERDRRSAPKGNVTAGQRGRNPALQVRDEARPRLPTPPSGFEGALAAAGALETQTRQKRAERGKRGGPGGGGRRPFARRSTAAKRQAMRQAKRK